MADIDLGKVVPERGIDYWTDEDKEEIIEETRQGLNIPTELSELNEDSTHRTVTDFEKETWNNKQNKQDQTLNTISKLVAGAINEIFASVGGIQALIPSQASASNQVADKDFVNSSLNSITAFYITKNAQGDQFNNKAELLSTTTFYSGGEVRVPTRNDYCVVLEDETKDNATTRYIYQNGQWEYQYTVNETALTAAQLAAINSGITQALVGQIGTNQTNIATVLADYITSNGLNTVLANKNINDVSNEEWVFTLSNNTTVTKTVKVGT